MQRVLLSALLILVLAGLAGLVVTIPPQETEEAAVAEGTDPGEAAEAPEIGQTGESGANVASEGADPTPGGTAAGETATADAAPGGGTTVVPQSTEAVQSPAEADIAGTPPVPADPGAPTFDVVRVEPSGEALIAGVAEPNAEVEVLSNGEVVATVTADSSGAFIAMPTTPLEPGEHLLTLRRAGDTSAEPEQEVAVVVPQDGGGLASVAPAAPAEPQIAAAPDAPASAGVTGPVASLDAGAPTFGAVEVEPGGEAVIAGFAEPNANVEVLSDGEVVAEATADTAGAFTATPDLPLGPGDHVLTLRRAGDASAEPEQEVAVAIPQDGGGTASVGPVTSAESLAATAPDASTSPGAPGPVASLDGGTPATAPTAGGAGGATADGSGAAVSATGDAASVQEQAVASAEQTGAPGPSDGGEPAADGADSAGSAGETGAGQADELIASAPPAASVAPSGASTEGAAGTAAGSPATASPGQASSGQPAGDMAAADASDTAPPATPGETPLSVAAAEAEGSSVYVAGQAEPGSSVRVFANEDLLGEAQVNASGNWMLEAQGEIPVGRVEIRADQTAGQNVVARTVTPFVRYPGYTPLIPNADTAAGLPASLDAATEIPIPANVIIRSGDNLWTISRRTYGHGIRYKSIYSANSDLIRNPDLIYPGQVFLLPTQRPGGGAAEAPLTQ